MPGGKNGEARDCPSPPNTVGRLTSARHRSTSAPQGAWHCCLLVVVAHVSKLLKVDLVSEKTTDTTEALDELVALGGSIRDELKSGTKVLVVLSNPFQERLLGNNLHLLAGLLVEELVSVALLLLLGGVEDDLATVVVLENPAGDLKVLKDDKSLDSTQLKGLEGILDTVADLAGILANFLKVLSNELLLLDELDVAKGLGRQLNSLVETVLTTVRNINNLDDLCRKTVIKQVGGVQVALEIGRTSKDETSNVNLVGSDEVLDSQLSNLSDVVVTLFLSQTGETESGLTTTTVLLGKIDRELVDNFTGVSAQGSEQGTVTIHDDETELLVGLEQLSQGLSVELVVAQVKGGVDGLEGLEIDVDLSLLSFLGQDFTTVDDQAVRGDLVVQLKTLLGRGNGGQDGLSVDSRLDVGGGTLEHC
ncbi:hypothetical protein HG531_011743 [Fusarium graminearum]|nr:hypothetical protein HG531_011743 [Fusarium graminearum]